MRPSRLALLALALAVGGAALAQPASARDRPATIVFTKSAPRTGTGELWSVRADGSARRRLRPGMPVGPEGAAAALSRDRNRIICICRPLEVDSVDLHGGHLRRVGPQPANTRYDIVSLSATGRAFWVKRSNRIWTQLGASRKRLVTWARNAVIDEKVVPNPAGTRIAFVRYGCLGFVCPPGEALQVRTMNVDGSGARTIYRSSNERREIAELAWSPDGSELIFSSSTPIEKEPEPPVEFEYVAVGSDGSDPHPVAQTAPESMVYPSFTPNGTRLVAASTSPRGYEQLISLALDGSHPERIFQDACRWPICEFPPHVVGWR